MAKVPGIPTLYKGVLFRSRLEARWAAYFDVIGWPWEYEPFDLNGWIPDFLVGAGRDRALVEIKPFDPMSPKGVAELATMRAAAAGTHAATLPQLLLGTAPWDSETAETPALRRAWARAGNATQWRGADLHQLGRQG